MRIVTTDFTSDTYAFDVVVPVLGLLLVALTLFVRKA